MTRVGNRARLDSRIVRAVRGLPPPPLGGALQRDVRHVRPRRRPEPLQRPLAPPRSLLAPPQFLLAPPRFLLASPRSSLEMPRRPREPFPQAEPVTPAVPARVVTTPVAITIWRMVSFSESTTYK